MGDRRDDYGEMPEVGEAIRRAEHGATWEIADPVPGGMQDSEAPETPAPPPVSPVPPMTPAPPATPATARPPARGSNLDKAPRVALLLAFGVVTLGLGTVMTTTPQQSPDVVSAEQVYVDAVGVSPTSVTLQLPRTSVQIETLESHEVSVMSHDATMCDARLVPGPQQQVTVVCPDVLLGQQITIGVPQGVDLTLKGGIDVMVTGSLGAVTFADPARSVSLQRVEADSLKGTVNNEITGDVGRVREIDLTSLKGRVDLTFELWPRTTVLKAPSGDVSAYVPSNSAVALDLSSTHASVTSDVANTRGAPTKLTVEAGYWVSVTTAP